MRFLVGYTNQMAEVGQRRTLPGRETAGDDILAFGADYTHLPVTPDMTWTQILACCPFGWQPDVYIHWSPEYNPVPEGLETADCLTVGVFGDWNLGGRAMQDVGGLFDVLVADKTGCERLRNLGYANVLHGLLWACNPQQHRRLPASEIPVRDIDVLMIGNFNHAIQWERAPWLARVAGLASQYNVVLTSGVYGDEYVRLMNRAKIVFNRSIRGEANMRAFEAPACGALMFYEDANAEIGDVYTDGEHCVLYNTNTLETLLATYLAPENAAQRERIARAGWERAQQHSYAHHFATLLQQLEPFVANRAAGCNRVQPAPFAVATHWLMTCNVHAYQKLATLSSVSSIQPGGWIGDRRTHPDIHFAPSFRLVGKEDDEARMSARSANFRAALCGEMAHCATTTAYRDKMLTEALASADRAVQCTPEYLLARYNRAYLLFTMGRQQEGEIALLDVAARLPQSESDPLDPVLAWTLHGPTFPRRFDWFDVALERLYGEYASGAPEWQRGVHRLLTCRIRLTLAELAFARGQFVDSARHAEIAARHFPELGETQYALAAAYRALGRTEDAIHAYQQTLSLAPFHVTAREELGRLYLDVDRATDSLTSLEEWLSIIKGCPVYANLRSGAERLRYEARQRVRQQTAADGTETMTRLLAFPNWRISGAWQRLTRDFVQTYRPSDPVLLMLRVDPDTDPPANVLLQSLDAYLRNDLKIAPDAVPNITLLNQALPPADCWKLIHVAHHVIADPLPDFWRDLVQTAQLSVHARITSLALKAA